MRIIDVANQPFTCPKCGRLVYKSYKISVSPGSSVKRCEGCVKDIPGIMFPSNEWIERRIEINRIKRTTTKIISVVLIGVLLAVLFFQGFL